MGTFHYNAFEIGEIIKNLESCYVTRKQYPAGTIVYDFSNIRLLGFSRGYLDGVFWRHYLVHTNKLKAILDYLGRENKVFQYMEKEGTL